ncbi:two-component sensor histidine kinase, partial [Corynebacterium bovis]
PRRAVRRRGGGPTDRRPALPGRTARRLPRPAPHRCRRGDGASRRRRPAPARRPRRLRPGDRCARPRRVA